MLAGAKSLKNSSDVTNCLGRTSWTVGVVIEGLYTNHTPIIYLLESGKYRPKASLSLARPSSILVVKMDVRK